MQNIIFTVVYDYERRGTLRKDGTAAIYIRAYLSGKNKFFNTNVYVTPKQWHSRLKRVVHDPQQYAKNQKIHEFGNRMLQFENDVMQKDGQVSLQRLADYLKNGDTSETFTEFYEEQLEKDRNRLAPDTYRNQSNTLSRLKNLKSIIYFSDLDARFIREFVRSMENEGLKQNTVHKHYKILRKYLNLAVQHNKISTNPCSIVKVRPVKTDRLYLYEHELVAFEKFDPSIKEHYSVVLDLFLFSCYTGLRFSDVSRITQENITETPDGLVLSIVSQKTQKLYRQNLRKLFPCREGIKSRPEKIIERRLANLVFDDDPIFYYSVRNSYVRQLKKIAKLLNVRKEVKEGIASHTARHTFGTIMAGIVDVHILRELMQHSKIKETMIYVHLNRKMIDRALENANWFKN